MNRKNDFYKYNVETNTWTQIVAASNGGGGLSQNSSIVAGSVGVINAVTQTQVDP